MELLAKAGIIAIIIAIAVLVVGVFLIPNTFVPPVTARQAEEIVLSDLYAQDPNAIITVINVSQSSLEASSWTVVVTIVHNATRACPTLVLESFDYPAVTFVSSRENTYTQACYIYNLINAPSYIISSPYVAITKSFTLSNTTIMDYVNTYGYNNTVVYANFYTTLNETHTPLNETFHNLWLVNYTASGASYSVIALLNQSGSLAATYTLMK